MIFKGYPAKLAYSKGSTDQTRISQTLIRNPNPVMQLSNLLRISPAEHSAFFLPHKFDTILNMDYYSYSHPHLRRFLAD